MFEFSKGKGAGRLTMAQFAGRFLTHVQGSLLLAPATVCGYEGVLKRHVLPTLGGRPLAAITAAELSGFMVGLEVAGAPASTRRRVVQTLRRYFAVAVELGLLSADPAGRLRAPAPATPRVRVLAAQQIESFLAPLAGRARVGWALAFYGGLRLGELAALRWEDIDRATGRIVVVRSTGSARGVARAVPITAALESHLAAAAPVSASGYVFAVGPTAPSARAARELLVRAAAKANLPRVQFADARWSAAGHLFRTGYSVVEVAAFLGISVAWLAAILHRLR